MLHRDVKPSNILLTETGRLILADFGLAQVREATIRVTQPGDFWGSPHYSSPEQIEGGSVTGCSDLYSLAVVLHEILAGRVPFTADTPMATALAHLHQPPPSVHDLAPGLPPSADDMLAKGLAKCPEDRYQSGAALTEAVAIVAAEGGVTDSPPSWSLPEAPPAALAPVDADPAPTAVPAITAPSYASALADGTFALETSPPQQSSGWPVAAAAALLRLAATPLLRLTTAVLSVVAVVLMAGQLAGAWLLVGVLDPAAPRVIEASPPDGARGVTVQPELELRFSASMDAASVEAALEFEPPVPIRYEWQNDATRLLIVPTLPLAPATEYVLRLGRGARDLRGAALSGAPLARRFSTDVPRAMFLNVAANEDTAVGGSSGLAISADCPRHRAGIQHRARDVSAGNNAITAAIGQRRHYSFTPYIRRHTAAGAPAPRAIAADSRLLVTSQAAASSSTRSRMYQCRAFSLTTSTLQCSRSSRSCQRAT